MRLAIFLLLLIGAALPARAQRFAAIGDYGGAGPAEADVAALVHSWNPDLIITLGDNNYDTGAASTIDANIGQYYHDFIAPYQGTYGPGAAQNRFFPTLGNHDVATARGQPYRDYLALPGNERYYDFVQGQVHFFALNSDPSEPDGTSQTSPQAQWLKARLAAAPERWKVVYFHHPPYSSGEHGSSENMRWPFRQWGAALVLAGHDHHYERLVVDELVYCVNGLGGRSRYGLSTPVAGSQLRFNANYGALLCEAGADSLRLRFYTRAGLLVDSFTLRPGLSAAPQVLGVYPTPLHEAARVVFSLPEPGEAELRVLDALGRPVAVLHRGRLPAGRHERPWPQLGLRAGTYLVQLRTGTYAPVWRTVVQ